MGDNFGAFFTTSLANYHFLSSLIAAINQIPRDSGQNDRRAAGGQKRPHDSLRSPRNFKTKEGRLIIAENKLMQNYFGHI